MKKLINTLIILLILPLGIYSNTFDTDSLLKSAEAAYIAKDYYSATTIYERVSDSGYSSLELYYNIGNAYYKQGEYPKAILYYERALLLDPTDEDAQFNLTKAKTYVVDKIEVIPEFFIKTWFDRFMVSLNSDTWALFALCFFASSVVGFLLFLFSRQAFIKRMVFIISVFFVIIFGVTGIFSVKTKKILENNVSGIIMTPTVTVKGSPDMEGLDSFIIHEGTKVNVLRSLAGWYEVRIADGKQGWLRMKDLEKI